VGKIPRWEAELWSYVSSGNGINCPLSHCCQVKKRGGWCLDNIREYLAQLLDEGQFNLCNYDFIEAAAGKQGRLAQLVEKLAGTYLKMGNVRCPPVPTGIVSLADEQHSIEIRLLPLKAYHGAIWHLKEGWLVQLRDGDTSVEKRFTVFHEAFHILAHCRGVPVFKKRGLEQGSFNELLADYFAMCILAPREWVVEKWAGVKDLDQMAEIFAVPKSVMCVRLRQLGLISDLATLPRFSYSPSGVMS